MNDAMHPTMMVRFKLNHHSGDDTTPMNAHSTVKLRTCSAVSIVGYQEVGRVLDVR